MSVFVDTSALLALLDADDAHHADALGAWEGLADQGAALVTTNYVVVETIAVVQHRLGLAAVRALLREVMPLIDAIFIDEATHGAATTALIASGRRHLSFVDCVSFEAMRQASIRTAFAYDRHFDDTGFTLASGSE
jgi:predicted nucleic acid-binding protein